MTDLVDQLRAQAVDRVEHLGRAWKAQNRVEWKAADEIERLRAALTEIVNCLEFVNARGPQGANEIAQEALQEQCTHAWIDPTNEVVNANGHEICKHCGLVKRKEQP